MKTYLRTQFVYMLAAASAVTAAMAWGPGQARAQDQGTIVQESLTVADLKKFVETERNTLSAAEKAALSMAFGKDGAPPLITTILSLRRDKEVESPYNGLESAFKATVSGNSGYGGGGNPQVQCTIQVLPECCTAVAQDVMAAVVAVDNARMTVVGAKVSPLGELVLAPWAAGRFQAGLPNDEGLVDIINQSGQRVGTFRTKLADSNAAVMPENLIPEMAQIMPIEALRPEAYSYSPVYLGYPEVHSAPFISMTSGILNASGDAVSYAIRYADRKAYVLNTGTDLFVMPNEKEGLVCKISESSMSKPVREATIGTYARINVLPYFTAPRGLAAYDAQTVGASAIKALGLKNHSTEVNTCQ